MFERSMQFLPVPLLNTYEHFLFQDYTRTKKFLTEVDPEVLEEISKKKALVLFRHAAKTTPAYRAFLRQHHVNTRSILTINEFDAIVPQTDKELYIKSFPYELRCQEGRLPKHGNVDESGGTSGIATNWIHDFKEELLLFKAAKFEMAYAFQSNKKDFFIISAWSTGPWATGIKFCEIMERLALVKNTATDARDILNTLKMFGKDRNYLLAGYPPFLKNLLDDYQKEINWKEYKIDLLTGGEGVPLGWVNYVKKKLRADAKVVSSYGASDIDVGIGFETPFSFFIRELVAANKDLRLTLFKRDDVPMIFQYNPLTHYIREVLSKEGKREIEITLLDTAAIMPKIKYNIHDEGKRISFAEMLYLLQVFDSSYLQKFVHQTRGIAEDILHLPFLCIFGRSDGTLSFDGANVFPNQIEQAILKNKELAKKTNRFKIEKKYDATHTVQFHIHLELKQKEKISSSLKQKYLKTILEELLFVNPDFKESYEKNNTLKPFINIYKYQHPLFKKDDVKVKNSYFVK